MVFLMGTTGVSIYAFSAQDGPPASAGPAQGWRRAASPAATAAAWGRPCAKDFVVAGALVFGTSPLPTRSGNRPTKSAVAFLDEVVDKPAADAGGAFVLC